MTGPRIGRRARVPLFDRLVDDNPAVPHEPRPRRLLDAAGLRESVRCDLDRLLNTRTPLPVDQLERWPRSTLDYGIPDLSLFWPFDTDSEARLIRLLEATIAAFEPRLVDPRVRIERSVTERRSLIAHIDGSLVLEAMIEPVSFPILIRDGVAAPDAL